MAIDIATLSLILGITHLMQVVVFYYHQKINKNILGIKWWLLWSIAESIGFMLFVIRQNPSFLPFSVILTDPVILAGTLFIYIGVLRFFHKKVNFRIFFSFFSGFLLLHLFFYLIVDSIFIRTLIFNISLSVIAFLTAIVLFKNKTNSIKLTVNFNTVFFILHGCVFAYRSVMVVLGTDLNHMFSPTLFNFLPFIDALISSLLWTFGLIMMVNQHLNSKITEVKTHFELIFNNSPDAVIITRMNDGLFIDSNESFTKITGYSKQEISGKTTLVINLWKNPEERAELIKLIRKNGLCENFEAKFIRKDGEEITGLVSAKIIELNEAPHLIAVFRDISDRKKVEEEIRIKNEDLRRINAEKDKFFSIIAHDLRSPFNGFLGFTEILAEQVHEMPESQIRQMAGIMRNSAFNLFRLLENLLEWSRMEQGLLPYNPEPVHLFTLVLESIMIFQVSARHKKIKITYDIPDDLTLKADKKILQSIIRNLVSNAVKFTRSGGIISISAKKDETGNIEVTISDTGIGMPAGMIGDLFKIDTPISRKGTDGELSTGLGLILCKAFIEKHGGSIWVESEEKTGSCFHFIIPQNQ